MSLIRCDNLSIAFGDTPLLDDAQFSIERNERVCLIGRNGAGKSTLLKILSGEQRADQGTVQAPSGLRISQLPDRGGYGQRRPNEAGFPWAACR